MRIFFRWMYKEFILMLPVVIFFFCAFSMVYITEIILDKQREFNEVDQYNLALILVASLVMGKVVLIADHLSIITAFSHKPLIYNTIWKSILYVLCGLLVRIVEHMAPFFLGRESWEFTIHKIAFSLSGLPFWVGQVWLVVLFLIFVSGRELIEAIGPGKVKKMFFGNSV